MRKYKCGKCGDEMPNSNFGSFCEDCFADNIAGFARAQNPLPLLIKPGDFKKEDENDARRGVSATARNRNNA